MKDLKPPTTNTQEVLYTLIEQGYVSIMDYSYMSGFRTRVSQLVKDHGLNLKRTMVKSYNKFGNAYQYALHRLPKEEKEKAIEIYNKLTKD